MGDAQSLDHLDRLLEAFEGRLSAFSERDVLEGADGVHNAPRDEHLPRGGARTKTGSHVDRRAAVPALDGNGLSYVDPDPDGKLERGVRSALVGERRLDIDRGSNSLGRGLEDGERLIAPEFEDPPAPRFDRISREVCESLSQYRRCRVAALTRERRIAANISDEERSELRDRHPRANVVGVFGGGAR